MRKLALYDDSSRAAIVKTLMRAILVVNIPMLFCCCLRFLCCKPKSHALARRSKIDEGGCGGFPPNSTQDRRRADFIAIYLSVNSKLHLPFFVISQQWGGDVHRVSVRKSDAKGAATHSLPEIVMRRKSPKKWFPCAICSHSWLLSLSTAKDAKKHAPRRWLFVKRRKAKFSHTTKKLYNN